MAKKKTTLSGNPLPKETLEFMRALLCQVVLSPSEQDFEAKATLTLKVWKEINAALGANGGEVPTS